MQGFTFVALAAFCCLASSFTFAVTPDCADARILCVGPGFEYDTSNGAEAAFHAASSAVRAGDSIKIKGGTYRHDKANTSSRDFLLLERSGTASAPIRVESFDGEMAHLVGYGFDENATSWPSPSNETIIKMLGDYIELRRVEVSGSTRWGITVGGNHGLVEEVVSHDNWGENIYIYNTGFSGNRITGNHVRNTETYRSKHGSGITVMVSGSVPRIVSDTIIEDNIAYLNGYMTNGAKVPPVNGDPAGGGNSDGIVSSKFCHTEAAELGVINACPRTIMRNNIVWRNADDGFDNSIGDDSYVLDNWSLHNGPEGNKGFKGLNPVLGKTVYAGNVSVANNSTGMELRMDTYGIVANNLSLGNGLHGIYVTMTTPDANVSMVANNVALANNGSRDLYITKTSIPSATNWDGNSDGNPGYQAVSFSSQINVPNLQTVADKVVSVRQQLYDMVGLSNNPGLANSLADRGTVIPGLHCPQASEPGDDPQSCRAWSGQAPDLGPIEFGMEQTGQTFSRPKAPIVSILE